MLKKMIILGFAGLAMFSLTSLYGKLNENQPVTDEFQIPANWEWSSQLGWIYLLPEIKVSPEAVNHDQSQTSSWSFNGDHGWLYELPVLTVTGLYKNEVETAYEEILPYP